MPGEALIVSVAGEVGDKRHDKKFRTILFRTVSIYWRNYRKFFFIKKDVHRSALVSNKRRTSEWNENIFASLSDPRSPQVWHRCHIVVSQKFIPQ